MEPVGTSKRTGAGTKDESRVSRASIPEINIQPPALGASVPINECACVALKWVVQQKGGRGSTRGGRRTSEVEENSSW